MGETGETPPYEDSVDRHLARWRELAPFDERTEAIVTRMQMLTKHVKHGKRRALAEVGLQDFEFETLHRLASRGEPWRASPSELAAELLMSPAGMTGRLDTLEKSGLVRRIRGTEDRRRVDVEMTEAGHERWTAAMRLQDAGERAMVKPLGRRDQDVLSDLLKRMLVTVENNAEADAERGTDRNTGHATERPTERSTKVARGR